jgi:uncharacterized protein
MKIWIDITNTPHVNFVLPLIEHFQKKHQIIVTARDFSETIPLLKQNNFNPLVIGGYGGKNRTNKIITNTSRIYKLHKKIPDFDIAFSLGGNSTSAVSKYRNKTSIVFSDNNISFKYLAYKYGDYFVFPKHFNTEKFLKKYPKKEGQIYLLDGFKEDIYISQYKPNSKFLQQLPFKEYICIRPENLKASYVPKNSKSIVPDLFQVFKNENILFLPRYKEEREYAKSYDNIFIPDTPLNGLDVSYYSKAVLTGAGTFAREAAILGIPAVSFFPGKKLLDVDIIMQKKMWQFHSRNPIEIKNYLLSTKKNPPQIERSKIVFQKLIHIFEEIIDYQSL